jgi:hypothetical protein
MLDGAAFEREELLRLLKASRLPEAAIDDFERCNIGTIMQFASYSVGKLTTEPPDGPVLTALLTALRTGSALVGADKWPDPGVAAEVAAYTDTVTKMTMLCRFVPARNGLRGHGRLGRKHSARSRGGREKEP